MTKTILAAAAVLALLPAAGLAQNAPARIVVGPNGQSVVAGVGVQGRAQVRRHADALRFNAYLAPQNDTRSAESADKLVAALKANGVADAQLQPPGPFIGPNNGLVVTGTVRNPSDARLRELVTKVSAATPGVLIQNLSYAPFLDDCSADEQRAIVAAFEDARRHAALAAAAARVTLGEVVAMNVFSGSSGCPAKPGGFVAVNQGPRDAGVPTDVIIDASVNVTFAIAGPQDGARRRPL
ncbi:MAG TPA: SIMPL domain-containing protein [Candidatus Elarobacter sp.]|nr:SIMPL domain-containing protein [Candidatus Elarobacter sp.]